MNIVIVFNQLSSYLLKSLYRLNYFSFPDQCLIVDRDLSGSTRETLPVLHVSLVALIARGNDLHIFLAVHNPLCYRVMEACDVAC
jgi:hypothetical protein